MYNIDLDNISKILKKLNECKKKKKVRCCLYLMYKKMTKPKGKTRNSTILKNQYQILAASNIFFFKK